MLDEIAAFEAELAADDYKAPAPVSEEQKAEEQAVLDEIAAFEAELAAELGQ